MRENDDKIKDLEDYLAVTQKSPKLDKVSLRLRVLINHYNGVSNKENADQHNISVKSISRWVDRYENDGRFNLIDGDHPGRKFKIDEKQSEKIKKALEKNPLELELGYSLWNGTLLKRYINDEFGIEVSKSTCDKLLKNSNTLYKASNYDAKENKGLADIIDSLINEYESRQDYSVWYFDTYYLDRYILKKIVLKTEDIDDEIDTIPKGNDYTYGKYILYGCYNAKSEMDPFLYGIKNHRNKESKKNFLEFINEFVEMERQELKEDIKLIIVLGSNNIFKCLIEENIYEDSGVEVIFTPKNLSNVNKINFIWDELKKNKFSIKGKSSEQIEEEFEKIVGGYIIK